MKTATLRKWIHNHIRTTVFIIGLALFTAGLVVAYEFESQPKGLRMSAGPESTRRHALAEYLCEKSAQNKLSIELVPTPGSEACLQQLREGSLDVAIVNNGVVLPERDEITVLGVLQPEIVHVLVRRELSGTAPLAERIRGKRVNLGESGSTDWLLSRELLSFSRLSLPEAGHPGDILVTEIGKKELADKARAILRADATRRQALLAELPDCLLVVASMPSTVVKLLVDAADYRIEPLPGIRAFLADNMQEDHAKTTILDREFLEPAILPANSYFTSRGYPDADCETIGLRLLVVARKGLSENALKPLMATLFEREFSHLAKTKSPRDIATPYAIHPAAIAYLDRDKPLALKLVMDWITQSLSILGAFTAGTLSLYGLLKWKKIRKPADYFAEIRHVEQLARGELVGTEHSQSSAEMIEDLDARLVKLRQELIDDICQGRIKGDQAIGNIFALLKEVRVNLPKLPRSSSKPKALRITHATSNAA